MLRKRINFLWEEVSENFGASRIATYEMKYSCYPPGCLYYGYATPEILSYDPKELNYLIDPFVPGNYRGYSVIGYEPFEDREKKYGYMKGDLLKYFTDGKKYYGFISAGPDGIYEDAKQGTIEDIKNIILYDPSNGLYSRGDLVFATEFLYGKDSATSNISYKKIFESNKKKITIKIP